MRLWCSGGGETRNEPKVSNDKDEFGISDSTSSEDSSQNENAK